MNIQYVGPKPVISHTSIHFDINKEDKYVYIDIALQLLEALDHDYIENKTYEHVIDKELSKSEMMRILKKRCANLDELMDVTNHDVEDEINENLQRAHENTLLNDEEKSVLENNINIMHDYMIQRSVNKKVYYCVMDLLADVVQKDHIDKITLPMKQNYYHVLHTLQGTLLSRKIPIDTEITIYQKDKEFFVTLKVVNITANKPMRGK